MSSLRRQQLVFLGILFAGWLFSFSTPVLAANSPSANAPANAAPTPSVADPAPGSVIESDAAKGGPEDTIRQLLCTPTDYVPNESYSGGAASNPAKSDLYVCINKAYRFSIVFSVFVGILYTSIAGYLWGTGTAAAIKTAKEMIIGVISGLIILAISYIFLRQINPDLVKFKTIQPPELANVEDICPPEKIAQNDDGSFSCGPGGPPVTKEGKSVSGPGPGPSGGGGGSATGPAGHKASELVGCTFQGSKASQVPNMTEALFQAIKNICATASAQGTKPAISSITSGTHAANSFHYKGCATDFAGGDPQYTLHATGKAVIAAAQSQGMRINPGTDANQTFHVHVDIGSRCSAPVIPVGQRGN